MFAWTTLLLAGVLSITACGGGSEGSRSPDSPRSVVEKIANLANEGDLDAVMGLMAADVTYAFDGSALDVRTDEASGIEDVRRWGSMT